MISVFTARGKGHERALSTKWLVVRGHLLFALILGAGGLAVPLRPVVAQVAGELRGRVTDEATARPIADARIELSGRGDVVRSAPDGVFVVRGLEPRTYTISIRAVGHLSTTREASVSNGRSTVIDIELVAVAVTLGDVRVRAKRDTVLPSTAVFDRAAIEQSGKRDLSELLQTLPGIVVTQVGGPGQPARISIRGSSANQVLVILDGVQLNSVMSGGADLSRVALEGIERVTVRNGAQSSRYGPRALAGVIELESRKPKREVATSLRGGSLGEESVAVSLGNSHPVGSAIAGGSLEADYQTIRGDFGYNLPAVRGSGRATRINSDATSTQVVSSATLTSARGSATVRGAWQTTERGLAGSIVQPSSTGRQGSSRWNAGVHVQRQLRAITYSASADFAQETGTYTDSAPPFGVAFDDTIKASGLTIASNVLVNRGALSSSIGAEVRTLGVTSSMLAAGAPRNQQLPGAWTNTRYSRVIGSTRWQIDGDFSIRVDHQSLVVGTEVSPRVGVRLSRGLLAGSMSLGSGYAPPTLADQFFHEGVQVRANPNLKPERTRRDFETRLTLREFDAAGVRVSGEAAAYRSNIEGMILWMPDFRFIWSPSNFNVNRSGFELTGATRLPVARMELNGTLNRTDVLYAGGVVEGQVAYRPRNSAAVTYVFAPRLLRFEVTNRYIGARRVSAGTSLNALDPYWIMNATVSRTTTLKAWTFRAALAVENALSRSAAMLVDYPFPPRIWSVSLRVRRSTSHTS